MGEVRDFRRLRNYLLAYFIPLTGVPLLLLAAVAYFLISEAVSREIAKRSGPEISAVKRNIDTIERRMEKLLQDLARRDSLQEGIAHSNAEDVQRELRLWTSVAPFESLRAYTIQGQLISEVKARDEKKMNDAWSQFFGPRSQESFKQKEAMLDVATRPDRLPASSSPTETASYLKYAGRLEKDSPTSQKLNLKFAKFMRREDFFGLRELNLEGTPFSSGRPVLDLIEYKLVIDSEYRPLGILEGHLSLNNDRLRILSDYQGIDLVLLDGNFHPVAASQADIETKFSGLVHWLKDQSAQAQGLQNASRELTVKKVPVEFFFTAVSNELVGDSAPAAWIGVGLNKSDQILLRNQVIYWIAVLAVIIAGVVVLLTVRISGRITEPVSELVKATEAMKLGEWVHPVDADDRTEIGVLVKRFNEMVQSVQVTKRTLELKLEELARAHTELTKTQGHLVQSAKMSSLGQLVAGVAHELNNPIAFIYSNMTQMKLYLKNLERLDGLVKKMESQLSQPEAKTLHKALEEIEWDYVRKDMAEMVQSCLEGSVRVKDIVLGLRNFSRLDKGEVTDVDANTALENTAKLLNSQIKNRVEIHWQLCADARFRGNPSQINQVFMNILANGLQAIEGRGDVWIKTWMAAEDNIEHLYVSIKDSGNGISAEHIDKIFDPFFTTKKVGEGTGLGLAIVYGIIERHRGSIQVRSKRVPDPEHGTEFVLKFPRYGVPNAWPKEDGQNEDQEGEQKDNSAA